MVECFGYSGAASVATLRKSMRGCWRRGSEIVDVIRYAQLDRASDYYQIIRSAGTLRSVGFNFDNLHRKFTFK